MLNDIKQSQKDKYCTVPCTRGTQSSQNYSDRKQNGGYQGLRREGNGGVLFNGYRVLFVQMKKLGMIVGDSCTTI